MIPPQDQDYDDREKIVIALGHGVARAALVFRDVADAMRRVGEALNSLYDAGVEAYHEKMEEHDETAG